MVLLIIAAVVAVIVLVVGKVISLPLALVANVVVRSSSASSWEVPAPYIAHPTGAGEPPGVDRGDGPAPRRRRRQTDPVGG